MDNSGFAAVGIIVESERDRRALEYLRTVCGAEAVLRGRQYAFVHKSPMKNQALRRSRGMSSYRVYSKRKGEIGLLGTVFS
ncbi:hypothetical protein PQQ86_04275 [Paraburkholderia sediminicola]|uniref:hypothetical protein n=1 Tax=Paraburkholderia sediminicola TaxID=458836 RepID=UPI0038BCF06F